MNLGWIRLQRIICSILILQFCFSGNASLAGPIERAWGAPRNNGPTQPSPPPEHEFPEDIQRILRKVQACVDLPVCEDRTVPIDANVNFRTAVPSECRLTAEESARLRHYFDSLGIRSDFFLRGASTATLLGLIGLCIAAGRLLDHGADYIRDHYGATAGLAFAAPGAIVIFAAFLAGLFANVRAGELAVSRETVHRAMHNLGVEPNNVENALSRIPRQSWLKRTFSLAALRNSTGARATRIRAAINRLSIRTSRIVSTPTGTIASVTAPVSAPTADATETAVTTETRGSTTTETHTNNPATPPTGVRVCVPDGAVQETANALADQTLEELEVGWEVPAGPGQAAGGRRSGETRVGLPENGLAPSAPTHSRRRVLRDERPESPGALQGAVDASTGLRSAPALLPAPTAAGAAASETLLPAVAP